MRMGRFLLLKTYATPCKRRFLQCSLRSRNVPWLTVEPRKCSLLEASDAIYDCRR